MATSHLSSITSRPLVLLMVAAMLCSLFGCSSGANSTANETATTAPIDTIAPPEVVNSREVTVDAIDNAFDAPHIQIRAGTKVTFDNIGHNPHDVVPDKPGEPDFGVPVAQFQPGDSTSFTFDKPGVYAYYCSIHSTATAGPMRGYITVTK